MNQQRSRRFRAAKDNYEKAAEIKRLKDQIVANGGTVPADVPQSEKFDSNCITPVRYCLRASIVWSSFAKGVVWVFYNINRFFLES